MPGIEAVLTPTAGDLDPSVSLARRGPVEW
jgi:hypothetical protein